MKHALTSQIARVLSVCVCVLLLFFVVEQFPQKHWSTLLRSHHKRCVEKIELNFQFTKVWLSLLILGSRQNPFCFSLVSSYCTELGWIAVLLLKLNKEKKNFLNELNWANKSFPQYYYVYFASIGSPETTISDGYRITVFCSIVLFASGWWDIFSNG